ncbi:MAG: hypothetical protein JO093_21885 [Acidobacteria bacterium]|nr:hypothetical protein [Acidobacteriota bacterium]MBV9188275.1 hypothetical protein [Acidobacteriota bacterium]
MNKIFGAIIIVGVLACPAWAQPASFGISFTGTGIQVSGAPPGHDVLVFSISRETGRYVTTVVRRDKTLSALPGNKTVTWDIGRPIPLRSVWCAIDLQTGEFDVKAPWQGDGELDDKTEPQRLAETPSFPRDGADLTAIAHERADVFVLLVTPGRGAWILRSDDGGSKDEDARSGKVVVLLSKLSPFTANGAPPPRKLSPNDTVILIDPVYLKFWSGRVGREVQP